MSTAQVVHQIDALPAERTPKQSSSVIKNLRSGSRRACFADIFGNMHKANQERKLHPQAFE